MAVLYQMILARFDTAVGHVYDRPMRPQPKHETARDPEYLDFIRTHACSRCGRPGPSMAHHHPADGHSSVGLKTDDYRTVPACAVCHDRVHRAGKKSFWGDIDVEIIIARLNVAFFSRSV